MRIVSIAMLTWISVMRAMAQQCAPEPIDLVGWWPGDGNANDIVGGNDGMVQGAVSFAKGEVGDAFSFAGGGEVFISMPTFETQDSGFSVEAWIDPSALGQATIVSRELNKSSKTWWLGIEGTGIDSGSIRFILYTDQTGQNVTVDSPAVVKTGSFQHIAAVFDGRTATIYYNGKAVATKSVGPVDFNVGDPITIGREDLGTDGQFAPFHGLIDELAIYGRALSAQEVAGICNAGAAGKCML